MTQTLNVDLAYFKSLVEWTPRVGDFIIWHGWLQHWFGVVSQIDPDGSLHIVNQGMPLLLFGLSQPQMDKNTRVVHLTDVQTSTGGKYATIQAHGNNIVWYV